MEHFDEAVTRRHDRATVVKNNTERAACRKIQIVIIKARDKRRRGLEAGYEFKYYFVLFGDGRSCIP